MSPVLAEIPVTKQNDGGNVFVSEAFARNAEAYRDLRTNLEFAALESHGNVFQFTSSIPGEGKTTTACNVARAFAQLNQKVLLIDCDLRRPRVHELFGIEAEPGLTFVLLGGLAPLDAFVGVDGLDVLTAGRTPPNPAELLRSQAMAQLLNAVRASYDVVVIDAPPLLPVTDATTLARLGVGTVVVADSGRIRRKQLSDALRKLNNIKMPPLGIVLNRVKQELGGYYGYGYGYGPGSRPDRDQG